jgi:stage V sporulation protein AC
MMKDQKKQGKEQQPEYPLPIQGLVDLIGPEKPKGQKVSPGQPQLTPQEYKQISDKYLTKPTVLKNCLWAFGVGGIICALGQIIQNTLTYYGVNAATASGTTIIIMVFLGAFLTGLGIYDDIGKRAGAGSIVPITGFSNSMVAPAMEFKREGFVFGIGAKLFVIAGPVLVYGICASVLIGIIRYFLK